MFTGAVGVGIGFGLQKIVSNLVSGIILLADKSIKPGDVISVGDQFGWVTNMGARYTSVDTRDGREILVPNEDFVTQRVVNWSYSNDLCALEVKFGTTYASDPRKTQRCGGRGRAQRAARAEGAGAGLSPDRVRNHRDRIRAVVLDRGSVRRRDQRAQRRACWRCGTRSSARASTSQNRARQRVILRTGVVTATAAIAGDRRADADHCAVHSVLLPARRSVARLPLIQSVTPSLR